MATTTAKDPAAWRAESRGIQLPAGLSASKQVNGWFVTHTACRLPLHPAGFPRKADLGPALRELTRLGVDWEQPAGQVRTAIDQVPGGRDRVRHIMTSPEQRERHRRVAANAVRYLRALEAAGEQVVEHTSHGIAGTTYHMTCGCHRAYRVEIGLGLNLGEPEESLPLPCDRHRDLVIPAAPTDITTIHRELRRQAADGGVEPARTTPAPTGVEGQS
ncbi:hypothetical protein O7626_05540 [Micromonospora sp. WMMD1102]|uniref:hypothetical protein n=1 Tax=Micromonospora sp. WMMD1102 TaxID=3016105 RepID=UPI0024154E0D|nr:hypothetical protein [Micromonospora sp. WMMD1102]MDG4785400.1 hypothetical protein [Micromonospora sp. WMMD1102]